MDSGPDALRLPRDLGRVRATATGDGERVTERGICYCGHARDDHAWGHAVVEDSPCQRCRCDHYVDRDLEGER